MLIYRRFLVFGSALFTTCVILLISQPYIAATHANLKWTTKTESRSPTATVVHTVLPGETLSSISKAYYGTSQKWKTIWKANESTITNRNKIKPGTQLLIPAV